MNEEQHKAFQDVALQITNEARYLRSMVEYITEYFIARDIEYSTERLTKASNVLWEIWREKADASSS